MTSYSRDQSGLSQSGSPLAVVLAKSVDDVRATVTAASLHGVPIVTRGAGSGLAGGANAIDGCVVLVTTQMSRIDEPQMSGQTIRVEPGAITGDVKRTASGAGLYYPPDPASAAFCSIGGNIATNAGGLCCVKYGVTRDYVLGLDAVLPDGSLLTTGAALRKSVSGLDLTGLLVGSEGTLAVVVSAVLRLVPEPAGASTVVAGFGSRAAVGQLPGKLAEAGVIPSMLEVMDRTTSAAVEEKFHLGASNESDVLVIAQTNGPNHGDEASLIAEAAKGLGATEVYSASDPVESDMLVQARKLAFTALEASAPRALLDDVGVPIDSVEEMIRGIDKIGDSKGVSIATFGHLGDGNLHPTILYDPSDADQSHRAQKAFDEIVRLALSLGGTTSGEHGIGNLKVDYLLDELGERSVQIQRSIKRLFDPQGIMNPGKALPLS